MVTLFVIGVEAVVLHVGWRLELWDSDAIFVTQNLNVGYIVHQLDLMHTVGKNKVGIPNTCTFCIYYCTW